jgi:hypothetical protein
VCLSQVLWKSHFCQFTVGGAEYFDEYVAWKRQLSVWGDDPEIQAISELYRRPVQVYAFHPLHGATVLNRTSGDASAADAVKVPVIRWGSASVWNGCAIGLPFSLFARSGCVSMGEAIMIPLWGQGSRNLCFGTGVRSHCWGNCGSCEARSVWYS